jgi:hypothetical protein
LLCSTKDCHNIPISLAEFQQGIIKKVHRKKTYRQRIIDGNNAGPQGLHILVVLEDIILPRGAIPVNSRCSNLELEEEDSGTCVPNVPGPLSA